MNGSVARSIVDSAAMPMALLGADGAVIVASPPWEELFGATAHIGRNQVVVAGPEIIRNGLGGVSSNSCISAGDELKQEFSITI